MDRAWVCQNNMGLGQQKENAKSDGITVCDRVHLNLYMAEHEFDISF